MRAIDGYKGEFVTACALKLAPLLFVRPGELRHAEWSELDLDAAEWRIPAEKMKNARSAYRPAVRAGHRDLARASSLTGSPLKRKPDAPHYVFPGERTRIRPMSENTVNAALRRMGFSKGQMTGHGFRSTGSTRLHEMEWPSADIERQLAHAERNKVKAAYNYAEHLPERRKMMQAWSDYLERLAATDGNVVAGKFGKAA